MFQVREPKVQKSHLLPAVGVQTSNCRMEAASGSEKQGAFNLDCFTTSRWRLSGFRKGSAIKDVYGKMTIGYLALGYLKL